MRTLPIGVFCLLTSACGDIRLDEVRSKWKFGPEYRSSSKDTDLVRWTAQTGLEAKLSDGQSVGVTYRRRDNNDADAYAATDNGVWLEYSFPLWKRKKENDSAALKERVSRLEAQVEELRAMVGAPKSEGGS